ncbi:MAG: His-Xaa-Ser repeat protein HxsA [Flavobacteriales bacterium]
MSRFIRNFSLFVGSLSAFSAEADLVGMSDKSFNFIDFDKSLSLKPLNLDAINQYAAHRSHQSHRSHRSHRSSSGGSYSRPVAPAVPSYPPPQRSNQPTDIGRPAAVSPSDSSSITQDKELKLQVMRVQIALMTEGYYSGKIDGILGPMTREALKQYQRDKQLKSTGTMTSETLNALGISVK